MLFFVVGLVGPAIAQEPRSGLRVVVEGRVDAPFERVRAVLLDLAAFGEWFPTTSSWTLLEQSEDEALVHGSQDMPWPVRDRDYVVRYRWRNHADAAPFELEAVAQRDASPGPGRRVVRLENLRTVWRLWPEPTGTRVSYEYDGDTGIPLPDWVASLGWERYTGVLIEALARRVEAVDAGAAARHPAGDRTPGPPHSAE